MNQRRRLCRLALRRLRYLCFDIFLRRFLISEPIITSATIIKTETCGGEGNQKRHPHRMDAAPGSLAATTG